MEYRFRAIRLLKRQTTEIRSATDRLAQSSSRYDEEWEAIRQEIDKLCTCDQQSPGNPCPVCDWWNMVTAQRRAQVQAAIDNLASHCGGLLIDRDTEMAELEKLWAIAEAVQNWKRHPNDSGAENALLDAYEAYEGDS